MASSYAAFERSNYEAQRSLSTTCSVSGTTAEQGHNAAVRRRVLHGRRCSRGRPAATRFEPITVCTSTLGDLNTIRIATWNLEWATQRTANWPAIERRLEEVDADVVVLTEMTVGTAVRWPHVIDAGTHLDICAGGKRKVAIVSKLPLTLVDPVGSPDLPPANFLAVDVHVPNGEQIRLIAIVVRWAERRRYIQHFPAALDANLAPRTIVAGDFNHQHPATSGLALELEEILRSRGLSVHTAGSHPELGDERGLIDHIASTPDLPLAGPPLIWPRCDPHYRGGQKEVTDHAGSAVDFVM